MGAATTDDGGPPRSPGPSISPFEESPEELAERGAVAWGRRDPDAVLRGARVLLPTGELLKMDVAIAGRRIAAVAPDIDAGAGDTIDVTGKLVVPGYVEPHSHSLGPLSIGSYVGQALVHGTTCLVTDDAFAYTFLTTEQHARLLDTARTLPLVLRWSPRPDVSPRTVERAAILELLDRADVAQVGEIFTRPYLDDVDPQLAALIAKARRSMLRVEGHSPGASPRTLGAAAATGVTADHESISGAEVVARLRAGLWAFVRHNDMLPDVPRIVPDLLAESVSLERTALTIDAAMPWWIDEHGMLDAAIGAAIGAGMPAVEAYACATRRPATYMSLDAHVGLVAPGRLASLNVLADERSPRPERVFSLGREVVRDGKLLVDVPDAPWDRIAPAPWSSRATGPELATYELAEDDPDISVSPPATVQPGGGGGEPASCCVVIDPGSERCTRGALHGPPQGVRAIASTLTPRRLLVAIGSDPEAMRACVDSIFAAGGGIAFQGEGGTVTLPLPVGGAIATAPFEEVAGFWRSLQRHSDAAGGAASLGDPIITLLYLASESLPGPRFTIEGLLDTRAKALIRPSQPARWD